MTAGDRYTFSDYKAHVLHALGLSAESDISVLKVDQIVNDAIEHIAAMHQWRWLETGEKQLDLTADQDYVELPADFGALIAIERVNNGVGDSIAAVEWREMLRMRNNSTFTYQGHLYYCVSIGNVELGNEDAGLSLPTIALFPAPATSETGAIRIVYRRYLRRLVSDSDRPQWPGYMDRPLSLLSRGMALEDWDDEPANAPLAHFQALLPDLIAHDGLVKPSAGTLTNVVYPVNGAIPDHYPRTIANPTN